MFENHEQPKVPNMNNCVTDFFRVVGSKDWQPSLSVGPFLPVTSGEESFSLYKMTESCSSTIVDHAQSLVMMI